MYDFIPSEWRKERDRENRKALALFVAIGVVILLGAYIELPPGSF